MIVAIGGIKGGSGKSMTCVNLTVIRALMGKRVLLVDADEQRSASNWVNLRMASQISTPWTTIRLEGNNVCTEIQKLALNYDDILIDCGGRDTTSLRAALMVADKFIVPFQPKSFDVWTATDVNSLILNAKMFNQRLIAHSFVNCAKPRGSDNEQAQTILAELQGMSLLPVTIGQRNAFSNATACGKGVVEDNTDYKAVTEIKALHDAIYTIE
ncbi:AAA family ATPase [Candidatus Dependentiae bacterium]|nr:AAA family ATPase [Candidatus Dependentiae bacterium]